MVGLPLLSVLAYVTLQRGPIRAFDCWFADDIDLYVEDAGMTLGDFRAAVKDYTRNCITVEVVSGPTDDDAIVPEAGSWIFYRGDYTLEVSTVPGPG